MYGGYGKACHEREERLEQIRQEERDVEIALRLTEIICLESDSDLPEGCYREIPQDNALRFFREIFTSLKTDGLETKE